MHARSKLEPNSKKKILTIPLPKNASSAPRPSSATKTLTRTTTNRSNSFDNSSTGNNSRRSGSSSKKSRASSTSRASSRNSRSSSRSSRSCSNGRDPSRSSKPLEKKKKKTKILVKRTEQNSHIILENQLKPQLDIVDYRAIELQEQEQKQKKQTNNKTFKLPFSPTLFDDVDARRAVDTIMDTNKTTTNTTTGGGGTSNTNDGTTTNQPPPTSTPQPTTTANTTTIPLPPPISSTTKSNFQQQRLSNKQQSNKHNISHKPVKVKNFHVRSPHDPTSVGVLISLITPIRSIAGIPKPLHQDNPLGGGDESSLVHNNPRRARGDGINNYANHYHNFTMNAMFNESLFTLRVASFTVVSGGTTSSGMGRNAAGGGGSASASSILSSSVEKAALRRSGGNLGVSGGGGAGSVGSSGNNGSPVRRSGGGGGGSVASNNRYGKSSLLKRNRMNKLRYICIVRSTNRLLLQPKRGSVSIKGEGGNSNAMAALLERRLGTVSEGRSATGASAGTGDVGQIAGGRVEEDGEEEGYDNLYNPEDDIGGGGKKSPSRGGEKTHPRTNQQHQSSSSHPKHDGSSTTNMPEEEELSSFPMLVCLALQSDGTNPDIRKVLDLEKLVAIENIANRESVQLVFQAGEVVEIDCDLGDDLAPGEDGSDGNSNDPHGGLSSPSTPGGKHSNNRMMGGRASNNLSSNRRFGLSKSLAIAATTSHTNHHSNHNTNTNNDNPTSHSLRKERFLWSLLQIHAILCTSVVERNVSHQAALAGVRDTGDDGITSSAARSNYKSRHGSQTVNPSSAAAALAASSATVQSLPTLSMRNVDRAELQYVSTIHGFVKSSPVLRALLERQRNWGRERKEREKKEGVENAIAKGGEEGKEGDMMDGIAYDMIMGNFTRLTLFLTEEERRDAEEVLNSTSWQVVKASNEGIIQTGPGAEKNTTPSKPPTTTTATTTEEAKWNHSHVADEITTAETLSSLLQKKMRDLEAGTCRRLIAWEDEKYYSATGTAPRRRDSMEALSLSSLFEMLDALDNELDSMEVWLEDKTKAIKPLTDDCRSVEEENRQLQQQWKSYELLGVELQLSLSGLDVPEEMKEVLDNPKSKMVYNSSSGLIDIDASEDGVEDIYVAGRALKEAFDQLQEEGGVHLKSVNERVGGLSRLATSFCENLAEVVLQIMKNTVVVPDVDYTKEMKNGSHAAIAKTIRDTQRKFQSILLNYIKLIEVLALLKPSILNSVRASYSEYVSDGVLSKKRMKSYFASLPGRSSTVVASTVTVDLRDYEPSALKSSTSKPTGQSMNNNQLGNSLNDGTPTALKAVQAKDVEAALAELLPVIAREAYFTAALFGLSARHLSSREKKRNFENAKKGVDHSSQYFKYYMSRICGIASDADADGKRVQGDPMLSLVSSIILNESMDGYIDREKKGGDHSLSLAYVRATIIDLRKKVDRQWVSWVEDQIRWINTHAGVPLNGKRAGIINSFAKFPSYLDHVLSCCKEGRPIGQTPNLVKIKVVTYYLQKMAGALLKSIQECSERETTDQQYAANVMRMENSYFLTQSIKQRGTELTELFQKQILAASSICKQSTDAYLGWMIKREFKPLYSLFSSISRIRRDVGDADVPIHVSRSTFERTLSKECNREVLKEKVGVIFYRMEKHLSEESGLLPVAWKALVKVLYEWFGRWEKMSTQCYKLTLKPDAADVVRIAKAAAGISAKKRVGHGGGGGDTNNVGYQNTSRMYTSDDE